MTTTTELAAQVRALADQDAVSLRDLRTRISDLLRSTHYHVPADLIERLQRSTGLWYAWRAVSSNLLENHVTQDDIYAHLDTFATVTDEQLLAGVCKGRGNIVNRLTTLGTRSSTLQEGAEDEAHRIAYATFLTRTAFVEEAPQAQPDTVQDKRLSAEGQFTVTVEAPADAAPLSDIDPESVLLNYVHGDSGWPRIGSGEAGGNVLAIVKGPLLKADGTPGRRKGKVIVTVFGELDESGQYPEDEPDWLRDLVIRNSPDYRGPQESGAAVTARLVAALEAHRDERMRTVYENSGLDSTEIDILEEAITVIKGAVR